MEYQLNFMIELIAMIGTLLGSIFLLSLFFTDNNKLGNWSWESALIIQGIYTILDGITNTWLRPNLSEIVKYVREGTLDYVLLKPIDSQFWISLRTFSPSGIPEILLGFILVIWSIIKTDTYISPTSILSFFGMLLIGITILYSIWFFVSATSIWFVKTWNATEVIRAILASGRFPVYAYPVTLRFVFTFLFPIAFLTTFPAEALLGVIKLKIILIGTVFAILFFSISRAFWKFALRFYTSASS